MLSDVRNACWVERFRASNTEDIFLPSNIQEMIDRSKETGIIRNMIFHSKSPGTGKTTTAKALVKELGVEHMMFNSSNDSGVDVLRRQITDFVSRVSIGDFGGDFEEPELDYKIVILDEFDGGSAQFQKAFVGFIEEFADTARFIITCNNINKILPAIRSRCVKYHFGFGLDKRSEMMKKSAIRCFKILDEAGVEVTNKKVVAEIVKHFYPNMRDVIHTLQENSHTGILDETALDSLFTSDKLDALIEFIQKKDMSSIRAMLPVYGQDVDGLIDKMYASTFDKVAKHQILEFIQILNEFQHRTQDARNMDLCIMAFLSDLAYNGVYSGRVAQKSV